jgi:hypothetical protein
MAFQQSSDVFRNEVNQLKLELHNMHTQRGTGEITVGNYILTRLAQLGVTVGTTAIWISWSKYMRRKCLAYREILILPSWYILRKVNYVYALICYL